MPNILHSGRVNITDDVFHISDVFLYKKKKPVKPKMAVDGTGLEGQQEQNSQEDLALEEQEYEEHELPIPALQSEIIQSAMGEAARIVQQATEEAEEQKRAKLAQTQFEADKMRAEATEGGRREGFASVVGEMKEIAGGLEQTVARLEGDCAGFEAEFEEQLTWMAFEIAAKVLAKKVSRDDTEMLEMVEKVIRTVQNEPWVRVEVSQEMVRLIGRLSELFDAEQNIQISAVPAMQGSVQIETASGVLDASLKTQLENLKQYFEQTAKK